MCVLCARARALSCLLLVDVPVNHDFAAFHWLESETRGQLPRDAVFGAGLLGPTGKLKKGEYLTLNDKTLHKSLLSDCFCLVVLF